MTRTLRRPCLGCGQPVRGRSRHPQCEPRKAPRQQRGYDAAHDRLRAELVAAYHPADPCARCGRPLGPDPSLLDLGHTDDRRGWTGLEHRRCNRGGSPISAGQRTRRQPNPTSHSTPPVVA